MSRRWKFRPSDVARVGRGGGEGRDGHVEDCFKTFATEKEIGNKELFSYAPMDIERATRF